MIKKISTLALVVFLFPFVSLAQSAYPQPELGSYTGLYRLYNPKTNNHLYTVDYNEAFGLSKSGIYSLEGTVGNVSRFPIDGAQPLHRLYNSKLNKHAFIIGTTGLKGLYSTGYKEEAVIGYIVTDLSSNYNLSAPSLYWMINKKAKDYLLTTNQLEFSDAMASGYVQAAGPFYIN